MVCASVAEMNPFLQRITGASARKKFGKLRGIAQGLNAVTRVLGLIPPEAIPPGPKRVEARYHPPQDAVIREGQPKRVVRIVVGNEVGFIADTEDKSK